MQGLVIDDKMEYLGTLRRRKRKNSQPGGTGIPAAVIRTLNLIRSTKNSPPPSLPPHAAFHFLCYLHDPNVPCILCSLWLV